MKQICQSIALLFSILCLGDLAHAKPETFRTYVAQIDPAPSQQEPTLVFLTAYGRVLRVDPGNQKALSDLKDALLSGTPVKVRVNDLGFMDTVTDVAPVSSVGLEDQLGLLNEIESPSPEAAPEPVMPPGPTSPTDVDGLFKFMRAMHLRGGSQCFHRAYIWAYDTFTKTGIATMKVFMFFTRKYIREYRYKWWFHVTPFAYAADGTETVLDATFMGGPTTMHGWSNYFVKPHEQCPTAERYLDYASTFPDHYCFFRKTSMYYYHPSSVQQADRSGYVIDHWDAAGLRASQDARP